MLDLRQRPMACAIYRQVGETNRTSQVAGFIDLDDGQTGMLFVIRAEATIKRTAVFRARLGRQRPVAGFQPISLRFPIGEVIADQRLLDTMLAAPLQIENVAVLARDLGGNQSQAGLT